MRVDDFSADAPGDLVPVVGDSVRYGRWEHVAFAPHPLPETTPPEPTVRTFNAVANARAAIAALDSSAWANGLVGQLAQLGLLRQLDDAAYSREFAAPDVIAILLRP